MDRATAASPPVQGSLGIWLEALACRVAALGPGFETDAAAARGLGERLAAQRFHLAVLGQLKRGKSTLLNALLGEPVLPTGVVPLTAIPTFLRPGPERRVVVHFRDDRPHQVQSAASPEALRKAVARFVTESENPENRLGVSFVETFHPSPLLAEGVVLIDTPGIGSTYQHNTEVTLNFLEHCDAALFLLSADPPITEVEVEFCRLVSKRIPRLFFVLNKVDYLSASERAETLVFLRGVLSRELGVDADEPIFALSARRGLAARSTSSRAEWEDSGLEELEQRLIRFLRHEKRQALSRALALRAGDLLSGVTLQVELALRSLEIPLEELEGRLALFRERLAEAQRQRVVSGDLLASDRRRLIATLEEQAERLRQRAREHLQPVLDQALASAPPDRLDERRVRDAIEAGIPGYFEHVLGELSREFHAEVRRVFAPHVERAESLVTEVRRHAAEIFDVDLDPRGPRVEFDPAERPYWVTHRWRSSLSPLPPAALDRLLPSGVRRRRIERRFRANLEDLVVHNVENLRWQTLQGLDQTFRRFTRELGERMDEVIEATRGAIETSIRLRKERVGEVAAERSRLARELDGLRELGAKRASGAPPKLCRPA
ncbi:MAG: dynamin family protein [Myxococcota bacterium]